MVLSLYACSFSKVPQGFEKEAVVARAKEVVTFLSNKEYEGVCNTFSQEMSDTLDVVGLKNALGSRIDALGTFKEYKSEATSAGFSEAAGDYAIVVLVCAYENGNAIYTICVDSQGNICGLYMK